MTSRGTGAKHFRRIFSSHGPSRLEKPIGVLRVRRTLQRWFARCWAHEAHRVFFDRLVTKDDQPLGRRVGVSYCSIYMFKVWTHFLLVVVEGVVLRSFALRFIERRYH